jgi:hypothetical protein
MAYTVADLLKMPQGDLDALFTSSPPGPIPDGESNGTAIISPGTVYSADIATMVNHFAWRDNCGPVAFSVGDGSRRTGREQRIQIALRHLQ